MLDKYLMIELEDDDTETGGVAFSGERVVDFLYAIGEIPLDEIKDLDDLNEALEQNGICKLERILDA